MIASLRWAAPAALMIGVLGCGQEGATAKKSPAAPSSKSEGTAAVAGASQVTLKVEGLV